MFRRTSQCNIRYLSVSFKRLSHYDVLGVNPKATQSDITRAYRKVLIVHLVDGNNDKVKEVKQAFRILGNETLRRRYDKGIFSVSKPIQNTIQADPIQPNRMPQDPMNQVTSVLTNGKVLIKTYSIAPPRTLKDFLIRDFSFPQDTGLHDHRTQIVKDLARYPNQYFQQRGCCRESSDFTCPASAFTRMHDANQARRLGAETRQREKEFQVLLTLFTAVSAFTAFGIYVSKYDPRRDPAVKRSALIGREKLHKKSSHKKAKTSEEELPDNAKG